jgi:hypothetical protein
MIRISPTGQSSPLGQTKSPSRSKGRRQRGRKWPAGTGTTDKKIIKAGDSGKTDQEQSLTKKFVLTGGSQ